MQVPSAANAMPIIGGGGFFLPIPHHLVPPSFNKSTSISNSNSYSDSVASKNQYVSKDASPKSYSDSGHNKNQYMPKDGTSGLNIPKNLIVPKACLQNCTAIIGTQKDDIIVATAVTDAIIYGLDGNDIIQCGLGNCKAYGGSGNNVLISGSILRALSFMVVQEITFS